MSLRHFISSCGFAGMLCARAERRRKNGGHEVPGDWRFMTACKPCCRGRKTTAEAGDASYLRNRFTFAGVCLKSPSNWSLAHWKKRWELKGRVVMAKAKKSCLNLECHSCWVDFGVWLKSDCLFTVFSYDLSICCSKRINPIMCFLWSDSSFTVK